MSNGTESGGKSIHLPCIQRHSVFYGGWQHYYQSQQRKTGQANKWRLHQMSMTYCNNICLTIVRFEPSSPLTKVLHGLSNLLGVPTLDHSEAILIFNSAGNAITRFITHYVTSSMTVYLMRHNLSKWYYEDRKKLNKYHVSCYHQDISNSGVSTINFQPLQRNFFDADGESTL